MAEAVRVGFGDAGGLAMMAKQRAQAGGGHAHSARPALERNKESGAAVDRPFQAQIVFEQLDRFGSERQETNFAALAADADLCLRQNEIFPIKGQHLARAQSLQ